MKLRTKFLLQVLLTIVLIFLFAVMFINYNYTKYTEKLSYHITDLYSQQLAQSIESKLKGDMKIIEGMREVFDYYIQKDGTLKDDFIKDILKAVLINNPDFLAVWNILEMRFLDKTWLQFHGRRRIIAYMDKGQVAFMIDTVDVDQENTEGPYYKMKIGLYKEMITDPYFFTYSVKDTVSSYLETSLGKPLYYNNEFIGMVGIDVYLGKLNQLIQIATPFKNSYAILVSTSGEIVAHPDEKNLGKKITNVYPELRDYNILDSIAAAKSFSLIIQNPHTKEKLLYNFSPIIVADPKLPWALIYVVPLNEALQNVRFNLSFSIIISVVSIIVVVLLISVFITRTSRRIEAANEVLNKLSQGIIDEKEKLPVTSKDEIGMMYKAINELIDSLNNTVHFAEEIGKGNLDAYYELKSDKDLLGKALIDMKMNLIKLKREEEQRLKESERLNWVQRGITEINEILRMHSENLDDLAFEIIKFLVKYTQAVQGGFYLIEEDEEKGKIIRLIVAYAYDRKKQIEAEFEIGEGLIGRAIKERNTIILNNLPQGYVYVKSGLGDETPDHLMIVPLIFEDEVYGAIEILSFKEFDQYQQEFLIQAAYRIASSVSNITKSVQTVKLLEQFREQSKIIEQKEKVLENRIKELDNLKQEVETIKLKYEKFFEAIGMSLAIIEYNPELYVIKVNEFFLDLLQVEPADILGKKISELLPEAKENPKWFERFVADLQKGIIRKKITKYNLKQRIVFLDEVYIPITDEKNNLKEIICFGVDITKLKKQELNENE